MSAVEKNLIGLEDMALGVGTVEQTRAGLNYTLQRVNLVPAVESVENLDALENYDNAVVNKVYYKKVDGVWEIDPIPLEALEGNLGEASSRGATGPGDLLNAGYAGIGGAALANLVGDGVGLKASFVSTIAAGGPADEPTVVLTLPGEDADLARLAITLTNVALWVQKIGFGWSKMVNENSSPTFDAVKANSVRANAIGTPKD